jgi:glycosyltransferase involved in cell wall biosynthesis
MMNIAVLIPSYKPDAKLVKVVQELTDSEISQVIVVDDGSPAEYRDVFDQVRPLPGVVVLTHAQNQGKGAALKTGLKYLLNQNQLLEGVVTADADGQHATADILKVAQEIRVRPEALILGGRRFDKDVPWKSMAGNTITRWILRLVFGLQIYDSQTGLRGIPWKLIATFIDIPYDRYEFELEMLMVCKARGIPLHEITIQTIYINQNRASHFSPFKDAVRVYKVLIQNGFAQFRKDR